MVCVWFDPFWTKKIYYWHLLSTSDCCWQFWMNFFLAGPCQPKKFEFNIFFSLPHLWLKPDSNPVVFRQWNCKKLSNNYEKVAKKRKELLKHYFWLCSMKKFIALQTAKNEWEIDNTDFLWALDSPYKKLGQFFLHTYSLPCLKKDTSFLLKVL